MQRFFVFVLAGVLGCGAATTEQARPVVAENRRPEERLLPPDAATESLPDGIPTEPSENFVEPLEAGSCDEGLVSPCPQQSGILVSESRAARDATYRIRYPELRRTFEADRQVWAAQRELYEAQIAADQQEIGRLQPTWWERHDGEILAAVGLVVGAAITVAITFAVNQASE